MKSIAMMLLLVGAAGSAMALNVSTPEIDPASAAGSIALISGAVRILRARRKKKA